jgi:hypothetical protein
LTIAYLLSSYEIRAQSKGESKLLADVFVQVRGGVQFSGARKADVIKSNFIEVYSVGLGKIISPYFKIFIGIEGRRFLYLKDDFDHEYSYLYGSNIIKLARNESFISDFELTVGSGLFMNYFYQRPNICGHLGLIYTKEVSPDVSISIGIKSLVGWDIYQGDDDILNSINLGFRKYF